jgi:N-acetylglutamate synthase-like GNAT family acetyltransferase
MQVVRIVEPNPQLEMDIRSMLAAEGLGAPSCNEAELFALFDPEGRIEAAAFSCFLEDACFLHAVVVREESRKKGLGYALVSHTVSESFARGVRLYLVAVKARGFFERYGFDVVPREALPESIAGEKWFGIYAGSEAPVMMIALPEGERLFGD